MNHDSVSSSENNQLQPKSGDTAQVQSVTTAAWNGSPPQLNLDSFQLSNNVFIVLVIFLILAFSFGIIFSLLNPRSDRKQLESTELIRMISMILIVTGALLVPVIAGQIATIPTIASPLYSLLGTIAGYLLGKGSFSNSGPSNTESGSSSTN